MRQRVLFAVGGSPWLNLAMEEALANATGRGGFAAARVWLHWPAVVVGYTLGLCEEVDCRLAADLGVPVVRRFTGGGAVFHDLGNINVTIAVPVRLGVSLIYRIGTSLVLEALRVLGLRGRVENEGDVAVDGCKVSGSAAGIKRRSSLYHATFLVSSDMELLRRITKPRIDRVLRGEVNPVKYRPCSLAELGYSVSIQEAARALAEAALGAVEGYEEPPPGFSRSLLEAAGELCPRYTSGGFTLPTPQPRCEPPQLADGPESLAAARG